MIEDRSRDYMNARRVAKVSSARVKVCVMIKTIGFSDRHNIMLGFSNFFCCFQKKLKMHYKSHTVTSASLSSCDVPLVLLILYADFYPVQEYETVMKGLDRNAPSVPPQNSPQEAQQVEMWKKYIQWEKSNPLRTEDQTLITKRGDLQEDS